MPEHPDEAPRRAVVPRQTSYKPLSARPTCADCGEPIREGEALSEVEHESFGGVALPVHERCPE